MPCPRAQVERMLAAAADLERLAHRRLEWARQGQWEPLLASETRHAEIANVIDATGVEPGSPEAEALARRLIRIRELDRALQPLLEDARDRLGDELRQIRRKASGARAYQQVERGRD